MVLYYEWGSTTEALADNDLRTAVRSVFDKLGEKKKVLVVPPDFTRFNSKAGLLTQHTYEYYGEALKDILPALGTHDPVSGHQRERMFGAVPESLFRIHDWRNDVITIGHVPADMVQAASDGKLDQPWPAQLNKLMVEGGHDLILSIGQVVPHEVLGMANYNKNLFVGIGGAEAINLSHFIGAVYGMERMMGVADNPLRRVLNHASEQFLAGVYPLIYILTVIGPSDEDPRVLRTRGLYIGDDAECFFKAAALSIQVNFTLLEKPVRKVVAFLDKEEFQSTWLGNKAIYRTRMMIEDGGELLVLAPGVRKFGEDEAIDALIRLVRWPGAVKGVSRARGGKGPPELASSGIACSL